MLTSAKVAASAAASHVLAATGTAPSPLWYTARATGVVALILLTLTVGLGVAGSTRLSTPGLPRLVRSGLHRNISLLSVAFVVTHVVTTALDPYASISITSALVPFSSHYRPFWLSLGTIAFDMVLALVLTSMVRSRLSYRTWRAVHWMAYASWPIALWHGLGTGSDSRVSWLLILDAVCVLIVAAAALWRLQLLPSGRARAIGRAATAAIAVATVAFVAAGPLQHGWARRAGTPSTMLGSAHASAAQVTPARSAASSGGAR